ncbi:hypothetical protein [Insulibacter thermoxylanivorax]
MIILEDNLEYCPFCGSCR